jgi:hypothetical protein
MKPSLSAKSKKLKSLKHQSTYTVNQSEIVL